MITTQRQTEMFARLTELKRERSFKLDSLQQSLKHAIEKGYDFAGPNLNLFAAVLTLESSIRELSYAVER